MIYSIFNAKNKVEINEAYRRRRRRQFTNMNMIVNRRLFNFTTTNPQFESE